MLEPVHSLVRQAPFDACDTKMQWRCNLHLLHRPTNFYFLLMTPCCFVYAFRLPPIYIVVFSLALVALVAAKTAAVIAWRTRGTYPCTTTIDKEGLREKTPRSDTLYTWSTIKTFSVIDGDFYFYTTFGGGFIPSCAFANRADALNFVLQATALRHGARNPKNDWPSQDKNQDGRSK